MAINDKSIVQLSLKSNQTINIINHDKTYGSFYMIGKVKWTNTAPKNSVPKWQSEGIDFVDMLTTFNKQEIYLLKIMKDRFKYNPVIKSPNYAALVLPTDIEFNKDSGHYLMDYNQFIRAYNKMHKKDLIRRCKKHTYLFNPEFFIYSGNEVTANRFKQMWKTSKPPQFR